MRDKLPIPLGGLSDNEAAGDQPQGTTSEAVNVRSLDPTTGRRRLSQRAGTTKWVAAAVVPGGKVDALESVAYDVPRVSWTQETSDFEVLWEKSPTPGGAVYDCDTDRQGNVYALTVDGTVSKYNSAGELVDTIQTPTPAGHDLARRILVDEIDRVYVSATFPDGAGYVWQFKSVERPDGATVYEQSWEIRYEYGVATFDVRAGQLAIVGPGSSDDLHYHLTHYTGVWTSFPLQLWDRVVPAPTNAVSFSSVGDVITCSEPNDSRGGYDGDTGEPYGPSAINWVPHEEYASSTRFHSWLDAQQINGLVSGDRVLKWEDRRYVATNEVNDDGSNHLVTGQPGGTDHDNPNVHENPPLDQLADRYLSNDEGILNEPAEHEKLRAPRYVKGLQGTYASVFFDSEEFGKVWGSGAGGPSNPTFPGNMLLSRPTSSAAFAYKSDQNGDGQNDSAGSNATLANSVVPGHDTHLQTGQHDLPPGTPPEDFIEFGNGFTFSIAVQLPSPSGIPQVIWSSQGPSGQIANIRYSLVYNGRFYNQQWDFASEYNGDLTLHVEDFGGNSAVYNSLRISYGLWNPDPAEDNPANFAIITFVHGGLDHNNESSLYVNGHFADKEGWNSLSQDIVSTVFGSHRYSNKYDAGLDLFASPEFSPFKGYLFEALCFLHPDDDAGANDLDSTTDFVGGVWGKVQPHTAVGNLPDLGNQSGTMDYATYAGDEEAYTKLATTVERLEGYLAHKYGHAFVLPNTLSSVQDSEDFYPPHPFGGDRIPVGSHEGYDGVAGFGDGVSGTLDSKAGIVAKFAGSSGEAIWALDGSGLGYGVVVDHEDNTLNVGPIDEGAWIARKVIDLGKNYSEAHSRGAWEKVGTSATEQGTAANRPRLRVDSAGDLYWPYRTATTFNQFLKLKNSDGTTLWTHTLPEAGQRSQSIAFPPLLPAYGDSSITGPEFAYVACTDAGSESSLLYKLRLVSSEQDVATGQTLRRHSLVVIGQGDIHAVQDGVASTPSGGENALSAHSPYVWAVQLFGQVFITDGNAYKVFDPKLSTVEDWTPKDGGELPARGRILTAWRGRIIISRAADDPYELYASALGDPYAWDAYPAALSVTQAWKGRAAGVGRAPDIVNAFIPMTDDIAYIGGDHSIHRMTGDPAAGGDVDVITDQVGIAYGQSWTKDPLGRLFFFSSRGGIYVMHPQGGYERVSVDAIERRLQNLNLLEYRVRLVWDYRREGLWVLPVPITIGGVAHRSWFWESKTNAWWEDDWASTGIQPSAATVFDGDDPDDRKVLFGTEGGHVVYVDEAAVGDQGERIDSRVLIGPLVPTGHDLSFRVMRPQIVLASEQGGLDYELLSSDVADDPGTWWGKGRVEAGRSKYMPARTRGAAVWARLRNNRTNERWSLEDFTLGLAPAGRSRVR